MLNGFSITNYKAFEQATMEIRPITLLLGANNIGKTSLLQFLLMLQQTALASEKYQAALKLHGGYLSLGQGKNIFRNFETEKEVRFSLDFKDGSVAQKLVDLVIADKFSDLFNFLRFTAHIFEDDRGTIGNLEIMKKIYPRAYFDNKADSIEFEFLDALDSLSKNVRRLRSKINAEPQSEVQLARALNPAFLNIDSRKDEVIAAIRFVFAVTRKLRANPNFVVDLSIILENDVLQISRFIVQAGGEEVIRIDFPSVASRKFVFFAPDIPASFLTNKFFEVLRLFFRRPKTIFAFVDLEPDVNAGREFYYLAKTVATVISQVLGSIDDYFEEKNVNYVSPLRAHPKRYYFLDKAKINLYLDTLDGDAMAEVLKDNDRIHKLVNNWLQRFGLRVDVSVFEDIIHRLVVRQNDCLNLDITDVGFGISQVLPVIIQGFLSSDDSITLIEQPEIHLHPRMQADLADLFIDIVRVRKNKKNKYSRSLIIETHSEYLLRRLRRRMVEGVIDSESVGIYVVSKSQIEGKTNSVIQEIKITEDGKFEYPLEFYGGDLFDDMISA